MSRTKHGNLAARMGRWSAAHWKTATFGWLAFVAVAFALGGLVGTTTIDTDKPGRGESGRMDRILDAGFEQPAAESVLIQSRSLSARDPAFKAAIEDVVARVSKVADVRNVRSPLDPGRAGQIAKDGHAALVEFDIRGDKDEAADKIDPVLDAVAAAQHAHPGFFIGEFGEASAVKAIQTAYGDDLGKAGLLSLPITLVILVVAFGALVAAGIPLLLALTAVFATFGLIALPSSLLPVADQAYAMVLLIGLAVGVDYSMFYLKRERQERAAGRSERAALEAAAATSGRSVLVSGLTVIVAMAGMFLTGDATFASLGVATILVVAVAVLGSLTVLPALLSRLGDRVERLRVPLIGRLRHDDGDGRIWGAIVDWVLRRPRLSAALAAALLLALAAPALGLRLATPGPDTYPSSLEVVKSYTRMQEAFPGAALPATVVVKAPNVNAPEMQEAIAGLKQQALASGRMYEPITVDVNEDATVASIAVPIAGEGTDAASVASLELLRETLVPETVGALPDAEAGVTGLTAAWTDQADELESKLPPVVGFVLLFAFALMLVAFRSIVIAVKAIVLNLLSVAAAYGVLVLVFQHGVGKGLLGFSSTAGIDPVVPLLLFVILFGLSMDYHVFILSRIREAFDRGATMDDAIAKGITSTAGVVTSAAIVMAFVFAVFATLSMLFFKQFGVGLAAAILIDATIVRAVLLPATMKLLGDRNWYLPRWLEWLPRLEHHELEPEAEPEPEPQAEPAPVRAAERKRVVTPARVVGLLLVGLVALGLGYVRFGPDEAPVSVPAGAKAGDLVLEPCDYATENGGYAADCGTLVVPENRADPQSRLIALPVTRIRARSDRPAEPIFRLEGGPGVTNTKFANASRFADRRDVVLVGYRGVDGSVRLDCPEVASALERSTDFLGERSFRSYADAFRACADRLRDEGVDLAGYTIAQRVDDLEAARVALGYDRVDLLSESAGTRTAMIYAWRYPQSIHRSVMIGANPPGHFLWDPKTTDEQIRHYAGLCSKDATCRGRTDDLAATMRETAADIPDRWLFLPIKDGNVRVASFYGLVESTSENAPLSAPMTLGSWLSAAEGDPSGFWLQSFLAGLFFPESFVWGDYAAVGRADARAARDYFSSAGQALGSNLGRDATAFAWGGGELADAWPAAPDEAEYSRVRRSSVETLLVGGALDFATPPQAATNELLPYLPNGRQVVLPGFGHTTTFWTEQPEAGTRLINTFLDSGRVDDSLYEPAKADFTPEVTQTALAKGIAGTMAGLALLTVLSLLWMPRRVHWAGRFGRKASAILRSVYAIVLGLGGWFLGVLVVMTAMPGVPLDDELLAVLSVGPPVGLGVFWAWVHRDWPTQSKVVGLAGALGGALVGTSLGFHSADDLLSLLTAILGAVAGANLLLILLDMLRARPVGDEGVARATPHAVQPGLEEAVPSGGGRA
jgi:RND superfamily putative drug exporter